MTHPTPWTHERVIALRAMWREGVYARVIADQLGAGITRNACIGKAYCLGLGRHVNACNLIGRMLMPRKPRQKPTQRRKPPPMPSTAKPVTAAPEPPVARQELSEPVTIMELRFPISQCRWPIGEPSAGMLYCGQRTVIGSSWCEHHYRLAYQRDVPRRRMEAAE